MQLGVCCTGTLISSILVTSKGLWWRCIHKWAHLFGISHSHKTRSFRSAVSGDVLSSSNGLSQGSMAEASLMVEKYGWLTPSHTYWTGSCNYWMNHSVLLLIFRLFDTFFFWCSHHPYPFYDKASLAVVRKHNCKGLCLCWLLCFKCNKMYYKFFKELCFSGQKTEHWNT